MRLRTQHHLLLGLVVGLSLFAASGTAAEGQTPEVPITTLQATARIVYVEVVARDSSGHIVRGLRQSDFALNEDGKRQRIALFEEHTGSAVHPPLSPRNAGGQLSNVNRDARDSSLNIVLFDMLDTDPADQTYARERMISFLRALPPGKQVALFVLSNELRMVQGFTSDSGTLARAAQSIDVKQLNRIRPMAQQNRDTDYEAYVDSQSTIPTSGAALELALQQEDRQNLKSRLDAVADAFSELSRAVNGYPGRKNLFWLAGQFSSSTSNSLRAISTGQLTSIDGAGSGGLNPLSWIGDPRAPTGSFISPASTTLSERADRAVADSQIAVYPISLVGVETDNIGADQIGLGTAGTHTSDTMARSFHDRQESRSVMDAIAEETGGEAFYGNNDVSGLLRRGFEDSENYYTLAYQPTDHNWNSGYRGLKLSLAQHGISLSYRRGYYAMPEQPPANATHQFQTAMRLDTPTSTMLPLRVSPRLASGASPAALLDTTVDVTSIGFTTDPQGSRHARLLVGLMAYPVGKDREAPLQTSGTLNLSLSSQQYQDLRQTGVFVHPQLPLPSGRYVLRVGVLDTGSGRIGTLTVPITMP